MNCDPTTLEGFCSSNSPTAIRCRRSILVNTSYNNRSVNTQFRSDKTFNCLQFNLKLILLWSILSPIKQTPLSVSPLEIPVSPLNLTEDLKTTTADDDDDKLGLNESMQLQPTLSSLEVKLKAAEEEKGRIKKVRRKHHRNIP